MMVSSVVVTSPTASPPPPRFVCVRRSRHSRTGTGEAGAGGRCRATRSTCTNALPAPRRSAQRPPGGDLRLLRDRKIATRLKRDGAESLGLCGTARAAVGACVVLVDKGYLTAPAVPSNIGTWLVP